MEYIFTKEASDSSRPVVTAYAFQHEERACVLRTLLNCYFGGIIRLLNTADGLNTEDWKSIQRWIWKEVEQTKAKLDEMSTSEQLLMAT